MKDGHGIAHVLHDADALVAEDATVDDRRQIALENVEVRAANRRRRDVHYGVGGVPDLRPRPILPRPLAWAVIDERFHPRPADR